ncbi:MAG: TetR family transcriptional regulator, partial [Chloroflexota bacterium]
MSRTRGRRAGGLDTRGAIIEEARRQFGETGFAATTLRSVAAGAGVDSRLVLHYFGSKRGLFEAALVIPIDPERLAAAVLQGEPDQLGARVARQVLHLLDDPVARLALIGNLRAAMEEPEAADVIRSVLTDRLLLPIARGIGADHAELRAALVASAVIGLAVARHVVAIEPLAGVADAQLERALAQTVQGYLVGVWAE